MGAEFKYCQREIEMETKCDGQCDHCKNYYSPIETKNRENTSLPSYEESEYYVKNGDGSPLHVFIHENEPAGVHQSFEFRKQLSELIQYLTDNK
jgi:hypothetical protein